MRAGSEVGTGCELEVGASALSSSYPVLAPMAGLVPVPTSSLSLGRASWLAKGPRRALPLFPHPAHLSANHLSPRLSSPADLPPPGDVSSVYRLQGFQVLKDNSILYREWAPGAERAFLIGDFSQSHKLAVDGCLPLWTELTPSFAPFGPARPTRRMEQDVSRAQEEPVWYLRDPDRSQRRGRGCDPARLKDQGQPASSGSIAVVGPSSR